MKDFEAWYADAKRRHTGLHGVDYLAIRAEFNERRRQENKRLSRKWTRFWQVAVALQMAALAALIWGL